MTIGEKIKRIRTEKGITQKELAKKLGTSPQNLAQYETGKRNPKSATIMRIAQALECSPADLDTELSKIEISVFEKDKALIINGQLTSGTSINELKKACKNSAFTMLTEDEKLIVYYNSLNDLGKDKLFEYMELLLSSEIYRKDTEE